VRGGAYPLSRFAYMYLAPDTVSGDPRTLPPHIQAFLRFVLSPQGQRLVERSGYYPLSPHTAARAAANLGATPRPDGSSQAAE
jgi:phosphate transport system substrate-binding protein